jgi:nitroimidazol reductase NimA-like FMN-containing flavoprotein (pyridoxamine 5'-phosphate oxidase superfamily)
MSDGNVGELKTERVALRRRPDRGRYDHQTIAEILDQTFLCHIGFNVDGQPFVIPTSFGRHGKTIYLHGSSASRMLRQLVKGFPICVTVMLFDGLVLARSAFNHSMNYRSVVILGTAAPVEGDEKLKALKIMSEHMLPGRWIETRMPNQTEMRATTVLAVEINEASAKIRKGPPLDDEEDLGHPCWAGVVPAQARALAPVVDPRSPEPIETPAYLNKVRGLPLSEST